MHTSGANRFLVATWGRAGSMALCQSFCSHILITTNKQPAWQFFDIEDIDPSFNHNTNIIGHCHSIKQVDISIDYSEVFLCIRTPSLAAISSLVTLIANYHHVFSDNYINFVANKQNKTNNHQKVIGSHESFLNQQPFLLNINNLNEFRNGCKEWNNNLLRTIRNKKINLFNYDLWNGNVKDYIKSLNYFCKDDDLTIVKNPKRWEEYTLNKDEVVDWIKLNMDDDNINMEKWSCHTS